MRKWIRNTGLLAILISPLSLPSAALADDDTEGRRVLRQRDTETMDVQSAYAQAAMQKRLESIEFLRELLSRGEASGDRKAEMMLRLAELYYEQGRYVYFQEMEAFAEVQEECFNTEGCDFEALEPDNSGSRRWQEDSIRLYESILENYPRYRRADEAMYYLGASLQDIGRREEGVEKFTRLVKVYPESAFVCDAYVNIGEYYFDHNNAYKALLAYKKATAYRTCDKYGFALYKLGWSYFNVGEFGEAITSMKEVVAYSQAQREASGGTPLQLENEALKDLVRFFADAGEIDEALSYFESLGRRDLYRSMLKRLAGTYFEQGKWDDAIQTYRRLIAEDPNAPDNPNYQHEIIKAYHQQGNPEAELAEVDRMLATYGRDTAWARANASDPGVVQEAQDKIARNYLRIASHYHDLGRRLAGQQATDAFQVSYRAYAAFLENFPDNENAYEAHYQFAELLYKIERYDEAWDQYMAVVDADPQGEHSEFCAESAIFAAEEMVKREHGGLESGARAASEVREPEPLSEWEQRLVDSCLKYSELYPGSTKIQQVIYKSAYLLYNKFHLEEAARQFRGVIAMNPGTRQAEQAANLILDSFVLTEDWDALKENAKFFYEQEGLGSARFKREVYTIYQNASLKVIEVAHENGQDPGVTADAYLAFMEEFPDSEENARILNNATIYYAEAGRPADVIRVRHILVDDPRFGENTKYYYDQLGALGAAYEDQADFERAAFYYEKVFSLYPDHRAEYEESHPDDAEGLARIDEGAAAAIYRAGLFRRARGEWRQAIADFQQFIATFPDHPDVLDTKLAIARIYEEQENWEEAASTFRAFYEDAPEGTPLEFLYFARLHHGRALEALGQTRRKNDLYEQTVAMYEAYIEGGGEPGAYTEFVAEMMYDLAQPVLEEFLALEIKGCGCSNRTREDRALTESLRLKGEKLLEAEATFAKIIATGSGPYGLASLVTLGRIYENMGESLENSDIPFYLTEAQREMYVMALEDKVYPQIQKAIEAYQAAQDKAFELTLYDENTAFATRRLGVLAPEDNPGLEEQLIQPNATTRTTRTFDFETEL